MKTIKIASFFIFALFLFLFPFKTVFAQSPCSQMINQNLVVVTPETGGSISIIDCSTVLSQIRQELNSGNILVNNLSSVLNERQRIKTLAQSNILEVGQQISLNRSSVAKANLDSWTLYIYGDKISEGNSTTSDLWVSEANFPNWIKGQVGRASTTLSGLFKIQLPKSSAPLSFTKKVFKLFRLYQEPTVNYNVKISFSKEQDYDFRCPYNCRRYECPTGESYQGGLKCQGVDNFCCQPISVVASPTPTPTIVIVPTSTGIPLPVSTNTPIPPTNTPTPQTGWGTCGTCAGALPQYSGCTPLNNCRTFYQESICQSGTGGQWHAPCCLVDQNCSPNPPADNCGYRDSNRNCSKCEVLGGAPSYNCMWNPSCGNSPPNKPILQIPNGVTLHRTSSFPNVTLTWFPFTVSGDSQYNQWGYICARGNFTITESERYYFVYVKGPNDGDFRQICTITNIPDVNSSNKIKCTFNPGISTGTFQWFVRASSIVSVNGLPFTQSNDSPASTFNLSDFNPKFTCNPQATRATLFWNSFPGISSYALRINYLGDPWDGSCYSAGGDLCNNNIIGNSYSFNVLPTQKFSWWIHPIYPNGAWGDPIFGKELSCNLPTSTPIPSNTPTQTPTPIPCNGYCGIIGSNNCGDPTGSRYRTECAMNTPRCVSGKKCMSGFDGATTADWFCRNEACPDSSSCTVCPTTAPTITSSVPTSAIATPTSIPRRCEYCKVYDQNWNTLSAPYSFRKNQIVNFSTKEFRTSSVPSEKARFRINNTANIAWCNGNGLSIVNNWCETTLKHNDEWYVPYVVINLGRFQVNSMLYNLDSGWY